MCVCVCDPDLIKILGQQPRYPAKQHEDITPSSMCSGVEEEMEERRRRRRKGVENNRKEEMEMEGGRRWRRVEEVYRWSSGRVNKY